MGKLKFDGVCLICGNDVAKEDNIIPGVGYTCDFCAKLGTKNALSMINADRVGFRTRLIRSVGHGRMDKIVRKLSKWGGNRERESEE